MTMVLWSVDSEDYRRPGVDAIVERVLAGARPGAIILLHDATDVLACPSSQWNYLASTIDALRTRGFDFGVVAPSATPNPKYTQPTPASCAPR